MDIRQRLGRFGIRMQLYWSGKCLIHLMVARLATQIFWFSLEVTRKSFVEKTQTEIRRNAFNLRKKHGIIREEQPQPKIVTKSCRAQILGKTLGVHKKRTKFAVIKRICFVRVKGMQPVNCMGSIDVNITNNEVPRA